MLQQEQFLFYLIFTDLQVTTGRKNIEDSSTSHCYAESSTPEQHYQYTHQALPPPELATK